MRVLRFEYSLCVLFASFSPLLALATHANFFREKLTKLIPKETVLCLKD